MYVIWNVPRMLKLDKSVFEECHLSEDNGEPKTLCNILRHMMTSTVKISIAF